MSSSYQNIINALNMNTHQLNNSHRRSQNNNIWINDEDNDFHLMQNLFKKQSKHSNSRNKIFSGFVTSKKFKPHKTGIDSRMKKLNSRAGLKENWTPVKEIQGADNKQQLQDQLHSLINSQSSMLNIVTSRYQHFNAIHSSPKTIKK